MLRSLYRTTLATIPILLYPISTSAISTPSSTVQDLLENFRNGYTKCSTEKVDNEKITYCGKMFGETRIGNIMYKDIGISYTSTNGTERLMVVGACLHTKDKLQLDLHTIYDTNPDGIPDNSKHQKISGIWKLLNIQRKGGSKYLLKELSLNPPEEKEELTKADIELYNNTVSRS